MANPSGWGCISLPTKGTRPKENPYKLLYWMGAGILVLLLGVVALVMLRPVKSKEAPAYERTLLWLYDGSDPSGPGMAVLIEEARLENSLVALAFPAPEEARAIFKSKENARKAQRQVADLAGHQIHHRVFLPYQVVEVLTRAFGSIQVQGQVMDGPTAISYIRQDEAQGPARAMAVMMGIAEAAMERQPNLGVGEALKLAGQVETDMDLMKIPEMLQRWNGYRSQQVVPIPKLLPEAVKPFFHPDPVEPAK